MCVWVNGENKKFVASHGIMSFHQMTDRIPSAADEAIHAHESRDAPSHEAGAVGPQKTPSGHGAYQERGKERKK